MCDALDGGLGHGLWQASRLWHSRGGSIVRRGGAFAVAPPLQAQHLASTPTSLKIKPAEKAPAAKIETTRTRFIINLERHVDFEVSALAHPNRVLVDLPEVKLVLPDALGDTPVGLIKSFRHGMSAPGKSRVIIDVTGPVVVERTDIEKGPDGKSAKLMIDIVSASEATAAVEARTAMRAERSASVPQVCSRRCPSLRCRRRSARPAPTSR